MIRAGRASAWIDGLLLGPRMSLVINLGQLSRGELGVSLRGGEPLMAEKLLNCAQVGAFLKQMCAESVAKRVRMHICGEPAANGDPLDDATDTACGETRLTASCGKPAQLQVDE